MKSTIWNLYIIKFIYGS